MTVPVLVLKSFTVNGNVKSGAGDAVMQVVATISTNWLKLVAVFIGFILKAIALYRAECGIKLRMNEICQS
jgi:hypothetical protein